MVGSHLRYTGSYPSEHEVTDRLNEDHTLPDNQSDSCTRTHESSHSTDLQKPEVPVEQSLGFEHGIHDYNRDIYTVPVIQSNSCTSTNDLIDMQSMPILEQIIEVETMPSALESLCADILESNFLPLHFLVSCVNDTVQIYEMYNGSSERTSLKLSVVINAKFEVSLFVHV